MPMRAQFADNDARQISLPFVQVIQTKPQNTPAGKTFWIKHMETCDGKFLVEVISKQCVRNIATVVAAILRLSKSSSTTTTLQH